MLFIFFDIPDCAAYFTLSPSLRCPITPTWPPNKLFLPTFVEPDIPDWAAITVFSPISTLWPICIKLSSFTPSLIIVDSSVALSITVFDPIFTFLLIITFPTWGIVLYEPSEFCKNPKPSLPITAPEWIVQFSPILELLLIVTPEYIKVFFPIETFSPINEFGYIFTLLSI